MVFLVWVSLVLLFLVFMIVIAGMMVRVHQCCLGVEETLAGDLLMMQRVMTRLPGRIEALAAEVQSRRGEVVGDGEECVWRRQRRKMIMAERERGRAVFRSCDSL